MAPSETFIFNPQVEVADGGHLPGEELIHGLLTVGSCSYTAVLGTRLRDHPTTNEYGYPRGSDLETRPNRDGLLRLPQLPDKEEVYAKRRFLGQAPPLSCLTRRSVAWHLRENFLVLGFIRQVVQLIRIVLQIMEKCNSLRQHNGYICNAFP